MYRKHIILTGIFAVIMFDILLTYGLMWNPYSIYFDRPELSEIHFKTRDKLAITAAVVNSIILWAAVVWTIITWKNKKKFNPVSLLVSILTIWFVMTAQSYYPDSISESTEKGYQVKIYRWYLDGENIYKQWSSIDSLKNYDDYREIIWKLDSIKKE